MKILKSGLLLALVTAQCFAEPAKEQIVGHWRYVGDNQSVDYTFKADGTFTGQISEQGNVMLTITGNWSLDGNNLTYEITKSMPEAIAAGTTDRDKIIEITRDYYLIETALSAKRKYSRVD